MSRVFRILSVFAFLACAATAFAQFGHPLKGTWSGDWGPSATNRTHVVLDLDWDGKNVTGTLNPGAAGVALKTTVDPATWAVHFEGDGKSATGATEHYVIDGKLENLGAFARFITGTWTQGTQKGTFKITRN
jgi:hypothetical protein